MKYIVVFLSQREFLFKDITKSCVLQLSPHDIDDIIHILKLWYVSFQYRVLCMRYQLFFTLKGQFNDIFYVLFCINQLHLSTWFVGCKLFPNLSKFSELFKFTNLPHCIPQRSKNFCEVEWFSTHFLKGTVLMVKCVFNFGKLSH